MLVPLSKTLKPMPYLSNNTLAQAVYNLGENIPDKQAFIIEEKCISFQEIDSHSNQVARALQILGNTEKSKIAYLGKDTIQGYELLFGCAKAKMIFVGINWRLTPSEIQFIIEDAQIHTVIVTKDFLATAQKVLESTDCLQHIICVQKSETSLYFNDWRNTQSSQPLAINDYHKDDVVLQMYTSGTTGHPKGVQLANYSFFELLQNMATQGDSWMDLNENDTLLLSLPIFHIGGLWWAVQGFLAGAKGILLPSFVGWQALETIEQHKITKVAMVPAMIQMILSEPNCKTTDLSSIKAVLYGGSPIAPALMKVAMQTFDASFYQIYGMTETGNMAVCLRPEDHTEPWNIRMKAAGRPLPGVKIKVINNITQTELPSGEIGEICIKSPSNMIGYWNRPEATNKTLIDGWIHTGDAGYIDEEGYIYVCDRIKDMIISSGENIYPAEIEAALSEHEEIKEVAIIGIPDDHWGEIVKAYIVLQQGAVPKKRKFITFLRDHIADYKIPKQIEFVTSLPRNPSGKILKRELRKPYWQGLEKQVN